MSDDELREQVAQVISITRYPFVLGLGWIWTVADPPTGEGFGTQVSGFALTRRGALRQAHRERHRHET